MSDQRTQLLKGTLDLLILRTLDAAGRSVHGWSISKHLRQISGEVLQVNQGSLYPALHRLEAQGWISGEWATSELGRRARYYRLTRSGRAQLARETERWNRFVSCMGRIIESRHGEVT